MKKYHCFVVGFLLTVLTTNAQYTFTSHAWTSAIDTYCRAPHLHLTTNTYSSSLSVKTLYWNGQYTVIPITNGGTFGYADVSVNYYLPGTFTLKCILLNGSIPVDSVRFFDEYLYCSRFILKSFYDVAGDGIFDSGTDYFVRTALNIEVRKNGIIADTIRMFSGYYYAASGYIGDVFTFSVIASPGLTPTSASAVYDTIAANINNYPIKYFGFQCNSSTGFDVAEYVGVHAGHHAFQANILVNNTFCTATNATLTMHSSSKYPLLSYATPSPTTVAGNTVSWNLAGISAVHPAFISILFDRGTLIIGDTVHSDYSVTDIGNLDHSNNVVIRVDTASGSFDPNEIQVSPVGYILNGTTLTYTINFENTGNDTAFNIQILDTLSDNLDATSLQVLASSATTNLSVFKDGIHNVLEFSFPNINLLDSSHHGQCDGMAVYSIKTKPGLANGTKILNRAGIYFDYNPVVMTNTVENIIGIPSGVSTVSNQPRVNVHPNPANDILTIETGSGEFNTVTISNIIGIRLFSQPLSGTETKVNVRDLPTGIYFVTLKGEGSTGVVKFEKM
jgi:uncharacterized repeat protein (TIGR01451 family)